MCHDDPARTRDAGIPLQAPKRFKVALREALPSYRKQTVALIRRLDDLLGGSDGFRDQAQSQSQPGPAKDRGRKAGLGCARGEPRARNVVLQIAVATLRQLLLDDEVRPKSNSGMPSQRVIKTQAARKQRVARTTC